MGAWRCGGARGGEEALGERRECLRGAPGGARSGAWAEVKQGEPYVAAFCGSAVRHTGFAASLAAPHGPTEQEVIATAVAAAGLTGQDVDACEVYGIGNALADPVEANSCCRVLEREEGVVLLRASKSALGNAMHAGAALSLLQAILQSQAGHLGPNIHLQQANPYVAPCRQLLMS